MADEKALGLSVLSTIRDWVKSLIPGTATTSTKGIVQPDGTTITINNGVISSVGGGGGGSTTTWYGTSKTMTPTAEKVVTCEGFTLVKGAIISVLFTYANSAATPTLNVNSTGAKDIYVGNQIVNSTTNVLKWLAFTQITFMYDGTRFCYLCATAAATVSPARGACSWYGTSNTTATTAAKTSMIDNFVLTQGAVSYITFQTANTYVSGAITLDINSTGSKKIYVNNAATSSSNTLTWEAGETLTFVYSGRYYYFVSKTKPVEVVQTLTSGEQIGTVNGTALYAPSGSSGGVSYTTTTVTIAESDWSNNTCTKTVTGVIASNDVLVTYAPASKSAYTAADIYCTAQGTGTLTFGCTNTPTEAITVNVMIFDGGGNSK